MIKARKVVFMQRFLKFVPVMCLLACVVITTTIDAQSDEGGQNLPTIIDFSSTVTAVRLPEIETGGVETTLSWTVIDVTDEHTLNIQAYRGRAWETLTLSDQALLASTSVRFTITHPGNFASPTYRLIVTEADNTILDERALVIGYETPPALARFTASATPEFDTTQGLPRVDRFESVLSLDLAVLSQSSVAVSVRYAVINRVPNSDLVIEQLLPDGTAVDVEPPRAQRWIVSAGELTVTTQITPETTALELRLRVVDLITGVTFDAFNLIIPIGDAPAATVTADIIIIAPTITVERAFPSGGSLPNAPTLPAPPPTMTAAGASSPAPTQAGTAPIVRSFTASPATVSPGGVTRLTWDVVGAVGIEIQEVDETGTLGLLYIQLPAQGSIQVALPANTRVIRYVLTARGTGGASTQADVIVAVS